MEHLGLVFPREEKPALKARAKRYGVSVSALVGGWIRWCMFNDIGPDGESDAER